MARFYEWLYCVLNVLSWVIFPFAVTILFVAAIVHVLVDRRHFLWDEARAFGRTAWHWLCDWDWLSRWLRRKPEMTDDQIDGMIAELRQHHRLTLRQIETIVVAFLNGQRPPRENLPMPTDAELRRMLVAVRSCREFEMTERAKRVAAGRARDLAAARPRALSPPPLTRPSPPRPRPHPPPPPPRAPSPPAEPPVTYHYPVETGPRVRWMQKSKKHKPQREAVDPATREADKEASLQRVKERKAAQAEERKRLEAEEAERQRYRDIGRSINREERVPWRAGAPVPPPRSSLTGLNRNQPTHCTLADAAPLLHDDPRFRRDDDAVSLATTAVPAMLTNHALERAQQRGHTEHDVKRTKLHGHVEPGNDPDTYKHHPSQEGDPTVVTNSEGVVLTVI